MRQLTRSAWIAGLAQGSPRLGVVAGAFSAFGADWRHRSRRLDVNILYAVAEGSIRLGLASGDRVAGPGTLFWLSAGVTHSLEMAAGCRRISAWHARIEARDARGAHLRIADDCLLARSPELLAAADALVREADGGGAWHAERTQAVGVLLFTRLLEIQGSRAGGFTAEQEARILRAWSRAPGALALRPRDLAAAVGLAPGYFARRFAAHFGCPPRRWIVRQRMHRAAALLLERPRASIASIAAEGGFRDPAPFSRLFHREIGCTPSAFRARRPG